MNKPMQKLPFSIYFNTDSVKLKIANDVDFFSETKLIYILQKFIQTMNNYIF